MLCRWGVTSLDLDYIAASLNVGDWLRLCDHHTEMLTPAMLRMVQREKIRQPKPRNDDDG